MNQDFLSALNTKQFFRFTGPPEHWLTAVKCMTWGLERKYEKRWREIKTGDIFFIHSSAGESSIFPNAKSGIIGIGVVGFYPSEKKDFLWRYEFAQSENRWPLLIPFTEIYLFSELPDPATWESPTPQNDSQTVGLIDKLLSNRVPVSSIKGYPQMGSFSSVSFDVAQQILFQNRSLYLYSGHSRRGEVADRGSELTEVKNGEETLRYAASLRFLEQINQRIITKPYSLVERDNDILARAEEAHYTVLKELIEVFRAKGYATMFNNHVDLFAHDGKRSFLFEVKSTENKNFRPQARKGIVQLLEYDYFDISKFKEESKLSFKDEYKILVPSRAPKDKRYIEFINSLDTGVALVEGGSLMPVGRDFGLSGT